LVANLGFESFIAHDFQRTLGDILEQKCGTRNRVDNEAIDQDPAAFIACGIGKQFRDDGVGVSLWDASDLPARGRSGRQSLLVESKFELP